MKTQNLDDLVLAMRSMRVSDDFVQGALFTLGGVLMTANSNISRQETLKGLQWVIPHDINDVSENGSAKVGHGSGVIISLRAA